MNPFLATAFVMGAAGSAHCIGMCGPLALAVPSFGHSAGARWASTLLLNSGRLTTYALLGGVFGLFGQGTRFAGLGQVVSVLAGAVLLLSVAVPGLLERWSPNGRVAIGVARLRSLMARNLRRTAPEAIFLSGALNGLLPCGLVYAALLGAAAMDSVPQAMGFMLLFGLGTWPALFALRLSGALIGPGVRAKLRRAAPVLVSVLALLMILRGAGLDIPYLSPYVPAVATHVTACH